ncbi:MAG: transcription termination factor NusA, partial [Candidatus Sungbacteria bacterium RIFCSPLOWO2_01_FULL_59_16]
ETTMDSKHFGQAIQELAHEKGVPEAKVMETIELAVAAAYKKDYGKKGQIIRATFQPDTGELRFSQVRIVVDETMIKSEEEVAAEEAARTVAAEPQRRARDAEDDLETAPADGSGPEVRKIRFNPERHIMLEDAKKVDPNATAGAELSFDLEAKTEFGRIASQTAKQVIIQRIREAEREATYEEYKTKEGNIISGIIQRIEGRTVFLDLGRGVGVLPPEEQIARERYQIGERLKALLVVVEKDFKGPGIVLSRSHPRFLRKLFELEVPEIVMGSVEIKASAREAGSRSKVAVASNDPSIDPVGSMVGQRGVRVSTVMNELGGEKIDIIEWSDDPARFVQNALSPAKVNEVILHGERREATVMAPEEQLSLAIGKGGQNVRLAAKLTGWKIDVRSTNPPPKTVAPEPSADAAAEPEPQANETIEREPKPSGAEEAANPTADKPAPKPEVKGKKSKPKKRKTTDSPS